MVTGDLHTKFHADSPAVPELCSRTDRRVDHNTPHPTRAE